MIEASVISRRFSKMEEFEAFALKWVTACCTLNPTERNKREVDRWQKAVDLRKAVQ